MKLLNLSATAMAAILIAAAPALAQSPPSGPADNVPNAKGQHTDGGSVEAQERQKQQVDGADNPSNPREYDGAAEWHRQHTDGGAVEAQERQKQQVDGADNPSNPREYDGAAEWHKQHTQSLSHGDGSPATVVRNN